MKKSLAFMALLAMAVGAFGQGAIVFNNRITTTGTGAGAPVVAPIFGFDPGNPYSQKQGNPAANWNGTSGPAPVPLGTQVYGGAPLQGTGFTAGLWAANAFSPDSALVQIATTTFRTSTVASQQGFFQPLSFAAIVPDTPSDAVSRAKFQVRAWYNWGGTITTWDQAVRSGGPIGWSTLFTVPFQLGAGTVLPPNLIGLESFQLSCDFCVPEPSVLALGAAGAGFLLLIRTRKKSHARVARPGPLK